MKHHTKEEKKEILDALMEGRSMQDVTKAYDVRAMPQYIGGS